MLKKIICIIISQIIVMSLCTVAYADEIEISAPSALLMDSGTGQILYQKNAHEKRPCASITKIMTMCLVFEAIEAGKINYDTVVSISPIAASQVGSDIWLVEGERMTVDDLLKSVAVVSANDASVALAEAVGGSVSSFVSAMNEKAKSLGMNDTVFKNCNGLDEDGHVTSAYDVALMSRELMKHKKVFEYASIWLDYIRDGSTQLVNTNRLIKSYDGITGLKTGTTSLAGACISATAKRNDLHLIAVVLGDKTTDERFNDAEKLLNYGFDSFCNVKVEIPSDIPQNIDIKNGMKKTCAVDYSPNGGFLVKIGKQNDITHTLTMYDEITAPVSCGQKIGTVVYKLDGNVIGEFDVTSAESVDEINFADVFELLFQNIVKL